MIRGADRSHGRARSELDVASEYTYDALGRRIPKQVNTTPYDQFFETDESFSYDRGQLTLVKEGAIVTHRYLHGPLVDQVFGRRGRRRGPHPYWLLADHQGSVRDVAKFFLDERQQLRYDAFGNITEITEITNGVGTPTPEEDPWTRFTYTGQEFDPETGLYFYGRLLLRPCTGPAILSRALLAAATPEKPSKSAREWNG